MRQLYLPMPVWDLPTRLFHWALVVLVFTSWLTDRLDKTQLHMLSGYCIFTLLLFRVVWGFIGSDTARFGRFLQSPFAAIRHLLHLTRREPDHEIGHNAAGGWMVIVMLIILFVQVGTGLCSNDDVMVEGPLALKVGKEWSDRLTHLHGLNFKLIEILIIAHVLAITAYRLLKGHNLLWPMITGKKRLPGATRAPTMMHPVLAAGVLVVCALAVSLFVEFV